MVRHALLLVGDHLLRYRDDPERERNPAALPALANLLDPGLRFPLRLRVPVAVEGAHERMATGQVEVLDLVGRAHVEVHRAGMNGRVGAGRFDELGRASCRESVSVSSL